MSGDWTEVTVEEIAAKVPNALATGPFGSSISARFFQESGVPVIRGNNLSENVEHRLLENNFAFLSIEKAQEFERSKVRAGDLIFTCWGTIGQVGLIDRRASYPEYVISNKQMKLTPDSHKADSLFLYYLFSSPEMFERVRNQAIGTSVPGFNLGQLRSLTLKLPPITEQCAIAAILGSLDDKIELNRRMNVTLEGLARAIFQSWFVDFDPVRAKMEGRRLAGMDESTAALFPDHFEESELGEIPAGWRVESVGNVLELAYGKALKEENRQAGYIPVYGSNGQVGWHNEKLVDGPGIIVGRKGNPGIVTWTNVDFFAIDTTFYVVPKSICPSLYYLFHALQLQGLESFGTDSAVPGLNRNIAYMGNMLLPSLNLLMAFEKQLKPLYTKAYANNTESRTLAALRDTLLPKLLSGEVRV
jgi:type I restriction enzyme S subunit